MNGRRFAAAAIAAVALSTAIVGCRLPKSYDVVEVVGGLANPWDAAFGPNGELVVTERAGDVGVFRNGTYTRFNRPTDVVSSGEGGMMGVALDPSFATNRRLYTCYLTAADVRVVRWTVNAAWTNLGGRLDLVEGIPRTSGRHSGCRIRFGPDGALWITTGDAADSNNPQNPESLGGKVLRVTTDGAPAAGNMQPPYLPEIYAYGFRNPQGISFRPSDGQPFIVEHGPDRDDEITPLRAGGNGGWAPGPGYNENVPMTDTSLPDVMLPVWTSGFPTIAPSGSTFVTDADWGDFVGHLAVAMLKGQHLRLHNVADATNPGTEVLNGLGRLRVAVEGPDGRLYLLTDANPGRVLAVQPRL
jgi:glucose/arabinose dehydrogenase